MRGLSVRVSLRMRGAWLFGLYVDRDYVDLVDIWVGFGPVWVIAEWRSKEIR